VQRPAIRIERLLVVQHPTRDVSRARASVEAWVRRHGVELVEEEPDAVVALGGDGTVLGAIRRSGGAPVLGIACGSLGALTAVDADDADDVLDVLVDGPWEARTLPALELRPAGGERVLAFNDLVVVRAAGSQVRVEIEVEGARYARWAGDGVVVSTALGSSAYTLALGGPLLLPGTDALAVTPLAPHGGSIPSLVVPSGRALRLRAEGGHGGARVEIDGRPSELDPSDVELALDPDAATLVRPAGGEAWLAGLRRRGLVGDSPRIVADERRAARKGG
jgi:NAD+ kinase